MWQLASPGVDDPSEGTMGKPHALNVLISNVLYQHFHHILCVRSRWTDQSYGEGNDIHLSMREVTENSWTYFKTITMGGGDWRLMAFLIYSSFPQTEALVLDSREAS